MNSAAIRQAFLDFFESKGHKIVPSAPLVVKDDPTLMFINSGMAPFKNIFLGNEPIQYPRVANTQKCLRVSGKHNDLEEVGVDTYHHTMFEMLGNWSFGDYFKKEAIAWSWELLTEIYKLDKDRLYVTVFEGDESENLPFDSEAYEEWKKWISEDRILRGKKKDNFWEMGDTGPCGPCSEIHIDLRDDSERAKLNGRQLVNTGHPQVIEIWNNVFMEYERKADGSLVKLAKKHVDTGMGFERLCMAIQRKTSTYDTDVFLPTLEWIEKKCNIKYKGTNTKTDVAARVIADHIRAIAFTIADGQLPGNSGAGYVIRRILRRAVRYGYSHLNMEKPFLFELVPLVADQFAGVFPELKAQEKFVANVVHEEEASFLRTLANGLRRIDSLNGIDGKTAFELFDTYGFPFDLTKLIATERGWTVNEEDFNREMQVQKERARAASATEQSDWVLVQPDVVSEFVGYDSAEVEAEIIKYRSIKQKDKEFFQIVLDKTPFYAESGGQVGDTGYLIAGEDRVEVTDTKKENDLIVHFAKKLPEGLTKGQTKVTALIDLPRRRDTMKNHSATHLLQSALRQVLGAHVQQKGSLVHPDYLRFDFSHFGKMTDDEIARVEEIVNAKIMENIPLDEQRNVPFEEAKRMGATALFGEKYGEYVRVITFDKNFSRELCGGTHVRSTGEIGLFKIISESSIASGVRRIEAVTGRRALEVVNGASRKLAEVTAVLNNPKDLIKAIENLKEERDALKKQLQQLEDKAIAQIKKQIMASLTPAGQIKFYASEAIDLPSAEALRKLGIQLTQELKDNFLLLLAAAFKGKYTVHLRAAPSLGVNANQLLKELAPGMRGGGPPDFVQASASDAEQVKQLIHLLRQKFSLN
ncbi:MAG: alanine--tRNA ligase [Chitinophagales bacterium]|nr:alanine--tRNA ligase [Chitinophagales bacterium]MDW8420109.1 alanine--tRNA ligase [Chitinophagales bacterium]